MVSSVCFGDKLSLCLETNLAAAINHGNVFTHMKHLLWTKFPSLLVSAIIIFVAGRGTQSTGGGGFDKAAETNDTLSQAFTWNMPMLLIPLLIIMEEADHPGHAVLVGCGHAQRCRYTAFLCHQCIQCHRLRIRHIFAP